MRRGQEAGKEKWVSRFRLPVSPHSFAVSSEETWVSRFLLPRFLLPRFLLHGAVEIAKPDTYDRFRGLVLPKGAGSASAIRGE
jgi:hypothetical protein